MFDMTGMLFHSGRTLTVCQGLVVYVVDDLTILEWLKKDGYIPVEVDKTESERKRQNLM